MRIAAALAFASLAVAPVVGAAAPLLGDADADGRVSVVDAVLVAGHLGGDLVLTPQARGRADVDENGLLQSPDLSTIRAMLLGRERLKPVLTTFRSSPAQGEGGVAVTRETILRFDYPLSAAAVTAADVHAEQGGVTIPATIRVSSDRLTVTLFYPDGLPGGARVRLIVDGDGLLDSAGRAVDADGNGTAGGDAVIDFDTLPFAQGDPDTVVCGRVFASEVAPGDLGSSVSTPLQGATITVDGAENIRAVTDETGSFRMEGPPIGRFFVHVDGRTATNGVPPDSYYPYVGKPWSSVPGTETNVGDVYLPLVEPGTLQPVSAVSDTTIRFAPSVMSKFPEFASVSITVPAGALFADDGTPGGMVGIAPVPRDRLPGPLPPELNLPLVITVQTDGATNFDRPVAACFPNLPDPDTGEVLPPFSKTALWSFNHDAGRWEAQGSMTVSADGALACTDPGIGITQPGWHGICSCIMGQGGRIFGGGRSPGGSQQPPGTQSCPPGVPRPCCNKAPASGNNPTDPLNLFSGELMMEVEDLRIRGVGIDFAWTRTYRSGMRLLTEMGAGWDWSYNIRIEALGDDILLRDGNSRDDVYERRADGTWARPEMFRVLAREPDGTYALTFEDKGRWVFHPFDGRPEQGRIAAIVDRFGNALTFAYDALGRMSAITDTLSRPITVAYGPDGFFDSVTDFTGRVVRYEHYGEGSPDGSTGDLRSATTPAVTGTPNGNDFPSGKTTTYTYSRGFADDRLNHNLLTVTDGRRNDPSDPTHGDGPYLVNVYSNTPDPAEFEYDRVVRQEWGGGIVDVAYHRLTPSGDNRQAVVRTIVNDRVGNVTEHFYDERNRLVLERRFTGRATKTAPSTATSNRPSGRLRATDPEYYETIHEYNADSLETRTILPNGNVIERVYEGDVNPAASPRTRGNLRTLRRLPGTHVPAGDQAVIEELFEYDTDMGACCGFNFVTRHVDGRGNEIVSEYDDDGNLVKLTGPMPTVVEDREYDERGRLVARVLPPDGDGRRRRDELAYHESGAMAGYVASATVDAGGLALTTRFETDARGNVVRIVDPRGHDSLFDYNQLDQVVRERSRMVRDGGPRYTTEIARDANDDVIRVDVADLDENGVARPGSPVTTRFEHGMLGELTRVDREAEPGRFLSTAFEHDLNRNVTRVLRGEAVAGRQPANAVTLRYDERDLLFETIRAAGTPLQSTLRLSYDGNGNLVRREEGVEAGALASLLQHDGFDRLVAITDAMGNILRWTLDADGNVVRTLVEGERDDVPGSAGNVRMADVLTEYDALDRMTRRQAAFFDPATQAALGDGAAITLWAWSDASQLLSMTDDNGHASTFEYDTAWRLASLRDAMGNTRDIVRDASGNVVSATETDRAAGGGIDRTVTMTYGYDHLDRFVSVTDPLGAVLEMRYDSRHNLAATVDALRAAPGSPGNVVRNVYDGLDRLVETTRLMTTDGTGAGAPAGESRTRWEFDDSDRVTALVDPLGNRTTMSWDPLDRLAGILYADGTARSYVRDAHDDLVRMTDANGTVLVNSYDSAHRLTRRAVTPGSGVATGTTFEAYRWDALSRVVRAENDVSLVTRAHDSLGSVVRETQDGEDVVMTHDGVGNLLSCTYPSGRVLSREYDDLGRVATISDGFGELASFERSGIAPARRDLRNGTSTAWALDAARRALRTTHSGPGGAVDDRSYAWDGVSLKAGETDLRRGIEREFGYDSLYRLVSSASGPVGGPADVVTYGLDVAGNRRTVAGGERPGSYALNGGVGGPLDAQVNQYTSTPFDARTHDANGNVSAIAPNAGGAWTFVHDHLDRLAEARGPGVTVRYERDALGRRIRRVRDAGGGPVTRRWYHAGWQEIEEREGGSVATFVWAGADDLVEFERDGTEYFAHADEIGNVVAYTDATGQVAETVDYADYGEPSFAGPTGLPLAASAIGAPALYGGRPRDEDTGLYDLRWRTLDPLAGRFLEPDPLGPSLRGDVLGVLQSYAANSPWSFADSFGLDPQAKSALETTANVVDPALDVVGAGLDMAKPSIDDALAAARRAARAVAAKGPGGLPPSAATTLAREDAFRRAAQGVTSAEATTAQLARLGAAADIVGGVAQAYGEFKGDETVGRSDGVKAANAVGVAATQWGVASLNPYVALAAGASGLADAGSAALGGPKLGLFEPVSNGSRLITALVEDGYSAVFGGSDGGSRCSSTAQLADQISSGKQGVIPKLMSEWNLGALGIDAVSSVIQRGVEGWQNASATSDVAKIRAGTHRFQGGRLVPVR